MSKPQSPMRRYGCCAAKARAIGFALYPTWRRTLNVAINKISPILTVERHFLWDVALALQQVASAAVEGRDNAISHTTCNTWKVEACANDPNRPFRTSECRLRYSTPAAVLLRHFRRTF